MIRHIYEYVYDELMTYAQVVGVAILACHLPLNLLRCVRDLFFLFVGFCFVLSLDSSTGTKRKGEQCAYLQSCIYTLHYKFPIVGFLGLVVYFLFPCDIHVSKSVILWCCMDLYICFQLR